MASFFNQISEASMRWYDGLSNRERRLLAILSLFLFILLVFSTIYLATNKIAVRRAELAQNKQQLEQIRALEGEYLRAKEKNERAMVRIRSNDVSLFSLIQSITNRLGLSVKELADQKRTLPKSSVVEISVRVNLTKLSIDKVTALLEAIETSENKELVKVTKLKVNKRFDEPDLLDLQMTVSTWKSS